MDRESNGAVAQTGQGSFQATGDAARRPLFGYPAGVVAVAGSAVVLVGTLLIVGRGEITGPIISVSNHLADSDELGYAGIGIFADDLGYLMTGVEDDGNLVVWMPCRR